MPQAIPEPRPGLWVALCGIICAFGFVYYQVTGQVDELVPFTIAVVFLLYGMLLRTRGRLKFGRALQMAGLSVMLIPAVMTVQTIHVLLMAKA